MANPTGKGGWKKGQSGNPKGRPKKERALTTILERKGSQTVEYQGKRVSGKQLVPMLLWEAAKTGKVTLPDGRVLVIEDINEMMAIWKFLYQHIDGPPPSSVELTGEGGGPVQIIAIGGIDPDEDI